ncbi:unannotated protein [freshwater metagenome]|uniref:Unannotated protein n=1 Tax=freshwater metagenome TaxID=449393 RepID=A0A6J6T0U4_9ZZZZ
MLWPVEYVWFALLIFAMGGMWWLAYRMEPHWSAQDGRRFLCTSQDLTDSAHPGRRREARVVVTPDGTLYVTHKNGFRRHETAWTLIGKAPTPPKKIEIYVARECTDGHGTAMLSLRLPSKSRCIAVLDGVLAGVHED